MSYLTQQGPLGGQGTVTSVTGGTNINVSGTLTDVVVNLDDAITLATSVTSPLYTAAAGDVVIKMTDNAGASFVSFTNSSDTEVAFIDSLGVASFEEVFVTAATQYTVAIYGAGGALSEVSGVGTSGQVLTSNGAGMDPTWEDGGGTVTSVAGGTNINISGTASDPIVNLDDAIILATSVTSPLYTAASGNVVLNMTDDAGASSVSFTNNSDSEISSIDSLGRAFFNQVSIQAATQYTVAIYGASGVLDEVSGVGTSGQVLTSNGAGMEPTWEDGGGTVTSVTGGTNINITGTASDPVVNLDDAITLATSVTSPLYTAASGDVVIKMTDDAGANAVRFTDSSDVEVASIQSNGGATFVNAAVTSRTQYTVALYGNSGDLDEVSGVGTSGQVLTSNGAAMDPTWEDASGGTVTSVTGGTNINTSGTASDPVVNLDDAITLATSVTSPLYMSPDGNVFLKLSDDIGAKVVSILNGSGSPVASIDSLGRAGFSEASVSARTQYTVALYGASGILEEVSGVGTSGQVLTSNGAAMDPTWQNASGGGGITWNEETTTSATMAVDNGYIANNAGLVTLTLPTTAALGSVIRVVGKGAGGWSIAQNASESIIWDESSSTTTGVTGSLDSTDDYDAVELLCTVADTTWTVLSSKGNILIV